MNDQCFRDASMRGEAIDALRRRLMEVGAGESESWQWQRSHLIGQDALAIRSEDALRRVCDTQPFLTTPYYLSLADFGDPLDPILRQCTPDLAELDDGDSLCDDPFEERSSAIPGLVHRFSDRVVMISHRFCVMNCRHCTRKHLLLRSAGRQGPDLAAVQQYLKAHPEVREVILSGGDPLLLSDDVLNEQLDAVTGIDSVSVVRIGTRAPVVMPMRVTAALCDMLRRFPCVWVNTQFNHPRELTPRALRACAMLVDAGIPVSNQSVLLAGVNDDDAVMVRLCAELQQARVRPYYVFMCDPVRGTAHFQVSLSRALSIEEQLHHQLGGLACPRFVADLPGASRKVPISRLAGPEQD